MGSSTKGKSRKALSASEWSPSRARARLSLVRIMPARMAKSLCMSPMEPAMAVSGMFGSTTHSHESDSESFSCQMVLFKVTYIIRWKASHLLAVAGSRHHDPSTRLIQPGDEPHRRQL